MKDAVKFENLINNVPIGLYVVEKETFRILYVNDNIKNLPPYPKVNDCCTEKWKGAEACNHCPIKKLTNGVKSYTEIVLVGKYGIYDITATETIWDGIPAYIVTPVNHTLTEDERTSVAERDYLLQAAVQIYPVMILVNLTQKTYTVLSHKEHPIKPVHGHGHFNQLIDVTTAALHPNYLQQFNSSLGYDAILEKFANGKTEIYMEHPMKDENGVYHWTSSHIIRMDDTPDGDIIEITLARSIDEPKEQKNEIPSLHRDFPPFLRNLLL